MKNKVKECNIQWQEICPLKLECLFVFPPRLRGAASRRQGMPVVIQSPVASRKVASFCACACRRGQAGVGHMVRLAGAASQSSHSPGDCLTTVKI
eukprot:scaffold57786_cov66-Cyclotella_meneghiniana.AAC.5